MKVNAAIASWVRRRLKVAAHPYEGLPVIVVSGVGRSGTTALRHSLSAHPALHSTGNENNLIYDVLETARQNCSYPSRRATMHVVPAAYDRQFRLLLLNLLWPQPRRGTNRPRALLATSDLTPPRADYLMRVFPHARIAYIVRNGIEVVSSRCVHPHFSGAPFEEHCRAWCACHAMAQWGQANPSFVLVRQDTLLDIECARTTINATLAALGLPQEPRCSDVLLRRQFHPTQVAGEAREEAGDLRRRHERWRHWSAVQQDRFAILCGPAMDYFDYPIPWRDTAKSPQAP